MYTHSTQIRVRYGETDQMGYVYYGNYALYYEDGRGAAIRALGVSYADLEDIGVMMPVMNMNITYYRPALYDELLTIETTVAPAKINCTELVFKSRIKNEAGKLINEGETKLAFVSAAHRRKVEMPDILAKALEAYIGSESPAE